MFLKILVHVQAQVIKLKSFISLAINNLKNNQKKFKSCFVFWEQKLVLCWTEFEKKNFNFFNWNENQLCNSFFYSFWTDSEALEGYLVNVLISSTPPGHKSLTLPTNLIKKGKHHLLLKTTTKSPSKTEIWNLF